MLLKSINKRSVLLALSIIILDLIFKSLVLKNIPEGQYVKALGSLVTLAKIQNFKMVLGSQIASKALSVAIIALQLAFTYFAFMVQRSEAHNLFKYATILIVGGWSGNFLDKILFSNGNAEYVSFDYLNAAGTSFFFNLSGFMTLMGWLLLLLAITTNLGQFMNFFNTNKQAK